MPEALGPLRVRNDAVLHGLQTGRPECGDHYGVYDIPWTTRDAFLN